MAKPFALLKCLVKAMLRNVGKLAGPVPGADLPGNLVADAWENWDKDKKLKEKLVELEAYSRMKVDEFLKLIQKEMDEQSVENGERRDAFEAWLTRLPADIQKQWRRPEDPSGTTCPANTQLAQWQDLQKLLSSTWPRFRPGDEPISGYRLERPLGSGGFGEAWLADHSLGKAALKFMLERPAGYGTPPVNDSLKHEADVHKRLREAGSRGAFSVRWTFARRRAGPASCTSTSRAAT